MSWQKNSHGKSVKFILIVYIMKNNNFMVGLDKYFIAGLIIYLLLGFYLASGHFTDLVSSMCSQDNSETNNSMYVDMIYTIICNQITGALAIKGITIILFLFGVYIWLMLIYFVKFANRPGAPDMYNLNRSHFGFDALWSFVGKISILGVLGVILFLIIIGILHIAGKWSNATSSLLFTLNVINVITILALSYFYFLKQIEWGTKPRTFFELVKHIVFYIPCLFINLIEGITGIYNNTSHTVMILLLVEAVIITAYFVIPLMIEYLTDQIGTPLLKGPVYLNSKHSIGSFESLKKRTEKREQKNEGWWTPIEDMLTGHHKSNKKDDIKNVTPDNSNQSNEYISWQCQKGITDTGSREQCGKDNISQSDCLKQECCWDKKPYGTPSCYKALSFDGETYESTLSVDIPKSISISQGQNKNSKCETKDGTNNEKIQYDIDSINFAVHKKPSATDIMPHNFNYHYGLSFMFYINPQPASTNANYNQFTNILNYNQSPQILYKGSSNTLKITMKQGKQPSKIVYESKEVLLQRWNHVFINYDGGTLDVFINNHLVSSTSSIVPYMTHNDAYVGANKGINGGIKNVIYFNENLDRNKISLLYHSLGK